MTQSQDIHPSGTPVAISSDGGWLIGTYAGAEPGGLHAVSIAGGLLTVAADRIRGPGEIYIDSRGAVMEPMSFSDALESVHELANSHQPVAVDDPGNEALVAVLAWQDRALKTMEDFVVNHHEMIDESFRPPVASAEWPASTVGGGRSLDPDDPVSALRICLELGETGIPELSANDPDQADAVDRARQACDLVRDLIGLHGGEISSRITVIRGIGGPA
jgi:hypothetical protein